jgi:hypothetical protein
LQREADGTFRQTTYSANGLTLTQQSSDANAQAGFLTNRSPAVAPQPLPDGWKPGGGELLGRGSTPLAFGDFLNNGTSVGFCTQVCGPNLSRQVLGARRDAGFNVTGFSQLRVSGSTPLRLIAADVNGNGLQDAVVVSAGGTSGGRLLIYLPKSDDKLASPVNVDFATRPRNVAAFDLNGDGRLNLVTGNDDGYSVILETAMGRSSAQPRIARQCNLRCICNARRREWRRPARSRIGCVARRGCRARLSRRHVPDAPIVCNAGEPGIRRHCRCE